MNELLDFIADLIIDFFDFLCSLIFTSKYTFKKVTDITSDVMKEMKEKDSIKGVILDVDETIRFDMKSVPKENDAWINALQADFKVVVLTNGYDKSINLYFKEKGITVINYAHKPLKKYFAQAMKELNLNTNEILVIGDSSFADILGGNIANMITCKIKIKKFF